MFLYVCVVSVLDSYIHLPPQSAAAIHRLTQVTLTFTSCTSCWGCNLCKQHRPASWESVVPYAGIFQRQADGKKLSSEETMV